MIREISRGEGATVAAVLHELRTHLAVDDIPALVDAQRPEGYRVAASFDGDVAVAAAGFRLVNDLGVGRHVYIDDLVTLPAARGRGHARRLLEWVDEDARRTGCTAVVLDSNTSRHPAHRLYLGHGYDITAFHFIRPL